VLVDLERRRPVALLPGREADVLAAWLQAHSGVKVVARDRSGAYIDGARRGAPEATQVADRFHLLQNLAEALETLLTAHAKDLRALGRSQAEAGAASGGAVALAPPPPPARVAARAAERRRQRLALHQQAWALFRQGWSGEAVARELGIGRRTAYRWLKSETFPERQGRSDAGRSLLDPWGSYLLERWHAGCRDGRRLHGELHDQGYRGSYPTVLRYLRRLRAARGLAAPARPRSRRMPKPVAVPQRVLTPRAAAWLVLRRPEQRGEGDDALLARLRQHAPELGEAIDQALAFAGLVRERRPERLDRWLRAAPDSRSPTLRGFAKRLAADHDAVRAALIQPWSNGPTEGQINRLKMLKRTMHGRAGLDLLARRFLLAA
jgi:transposase